MLYLLILLYLLHLFLFLWLYHIFLLSFLGHLQYLPLFLLFKQLLQLETPDRLPLLRLPPDLNSLSDALLDLLSATLHVLNVLVIDLVLILSDVPLELPLVLLVLLDLLLHILLLLLLSPPPLVQPLLHLDRPESTPGQVSARVVVIRQVLLRVHATEEGPETTLTSWEP